MEAKRAELSDYPKYFLARSEQLQELIGYRFQNLHLLLAALTHSSFSNEKKSRVLYEHNERLEFLGDSILSLIVSRHLFSDHKTYQEGVLTKLRASLVCAEALFEYAKKIELGRYMLLSRGLEDGGGRKQKNVLADCMEAIIAALYLDAGIELAERFVLGFVEERLGRLMHGGRLRDDDYKSLLQEKVQTSPGEKVEYRLIAEKGPDHQKEFTVEVLINSNSIGVGVGTSKREAEQEAAREALLTWFGENEENKKG